MKVFHYLLRSFLFCKPVEGLMPRNGTNSVGNLVLQKEHSSHDKVCRRKAYAAARDE